MMTGTKRRAIFAACVAAFILAVMLMARPRDAPESGPLESFDGSTVIGTGDISDGMPPWARKPGTATEGSPITEAVLPSAGDTGVVCYATAELNIRDAPEGGVIGKYARGDAVLVLDPDPVSGWALTDRGYVSMRYLSEAEPEAVPEAVPEGALTELAAEAHPELLGLSFEEKAAAYADEAADALYSYVSDTIFVTITHGTHKTGEYYLSHVIIADPSQFTGGLSHGTYGGERETCTSAAARTGAVLLANGGYFSYDTGKAIDCCAFIYDGEILNDVPTHGREVCLKSDGTLFTPEAGIPARSLVDDGVLYSWPADPVLIRDCERPWYPDDVYAPRTAIGMAEPCEYYVLTSGTLGYTKGSYCSDMQDIFQALGCSFAANFDGGGSTTLVFRGSLINTPAYGDERPVTDFLCFFE